MTPQLTLQHKLLLLLLLLLQASGGLPDALQQQQQQQQQFVLQCQLRGHENWVRAVQFARVGEAAPGLPGGRRVSLLLASAAQDRCAIWAYISLCKL